MKQARLAYGITDKSEAEILKHRLFYRLILTYIRDP
jgi:hypothetical protein